jgi:hypothetical protein
LRRVDTPVCHRILRAPVRTFLAPNIAQSGASPAKPCLRPTSNARRGDAEPAEDSARDAALGGAAGLKRIVHHYADPSLTPRVSAPSAFEPGEEETLDLSSSPRFSPRLRVSASKWNLTHSHQIRGSEYSSGARGLISGLDGYAGARDAVQAATACPSTRSRPPFTPMMWEDRGKAAGCMLTSRESKMEVPVHAPKSTQEA